MRIAIGPSLHNASWHWCAGDLIPDLEKHHEITTFHKYNKVRKRDLDLLIIVKYPPRDKLQTRAKKIIYLPIDYFEEADWIPRHSNFLQHCNLAAVHCSRLGELLRPYCKRIEFVEHYDKYTLPNPANFNPEGIVIWTGMCTYVKFVDEWYSKKPRSFQLIVLTNRVESIRLRKHSRISLKPWTEKTQRHYFKNAKAGLDVKGSSFHQQMKPPTKVQQLVASGIPAAVNPNSYTWEYFHERGFDLADPDDTGRWFSEAYWKETRAFAPKLRQEISRTSVVQSYLNLINTA